MLHGQTQKAKISWNIIQKTIGKKNHLTGYDIMSLLEEFSSTQELNQDQIFMIYNQAGRRTVTTTEEVLEDEWTKGNSARTWSDIPWTGKTIFTKQLPGHELEHGKINDTFLKLMNCSSQGGYVMIFYDKRMETEEKPHMVSVTSWKSTKLKRKTVNALSAECQSLVYGIGHIHWRRYLLLKLTGTTMETKDWERRLAAIPYVSVVDSRSLYDCINKLVCTYPQGQENGN